MPPNITSEGIDFTPYSSEQLLALNNVHINRKTTLAGFLVLTLHVESRLAHGFDNLIK